jgi:hypothetical protein
MKLKLSHLENIVNNVRNENKLSTLFCEEVKKSFGDCIRGYSPRAIAESANYMLDMNELTHVGKAPSVKVSLFVECLKHSDEHVRKLATRLVPEKFLDNMLKDKSPAVRGAAAERVGMKSLKEALSMWPSDDQMRVTYLTRLLDEPTLEDGDNEETLELHADKRIGDPGKQQQFPELSDQWYETLAFRLLQDYDGNVEYSWERGACNNYCNATKATSGVEIDREKLYEKLMDLIEKREDLALEEDVFREPRRVLSESKRVDEKAKPARSMKAISLMKQLIAVMGTLGYKVSSREKNSGELKCWLDKSVPGDDITNSQEAVSALNKAGFSVDVSPYSGDVLSVDDTFRVTFQKKHVEHDAFVSVFAGPLADDARHGIDVGDLGESVVREKSDKSFSSGHEAMLSWYKEEENFDDTCPQCGNDSFNCTCLAPDATYDLDEGDEKPAANADGTCPDCCEDLDCCMCNTCIGIRHRQVEREEDEQRKKYGKVLSWDEMKDVDESIDALIDGVIIKEENDDWDNVETPVQQQDRWTKIAEQPENKPFIDAIKNAVDLKELARAKRSLQKADDNGEINMPAGVWMKCYDERKDELKAMNEKPMSSADSRMDRLLRTRDSSGKATPRKFS